MTRKDYIEIAKIVDMSTIVHPKQSEPVVSKRSLVIALCNLFAKDNPNFKDEKFVEACNGR